MSIFTVKCPLCAAELEADADYIGALVLCAGCEHKFTLWRNKDILPCYPDQLDDISVEVLATRGFPLSFSNTSNFQLQLLQEERSCQWLFQLDCPVLKSVERMAGAISVHLCKDRSYFYRVEPVEVRTKQYYLCKTWPESTRQGLLNWFRQLYVGYKVLRAVCSPGKSVKIDLTGEKNSPKDTQAVADETTALPVPENLATCEQETDYMAAPTVSSEFSQYRQNVDTTIDLHRMGWPSDLSQPIIGHEKQGLEVLCSFTLNKPISDLTHAKPIAVEIDGAEISVKQWKEIFVAICRHCYACCYVFLIGFAGKKFSMSNQRVCFSRTEKNLVDPVEIGYNMWVDTDFCASELMQFASEITASCGINLSTVKVFYTVPQAILQDSIHENGVSLHSVTDVTAADEHPLAPSSITPQTFSFAQPESNLSHIKPELLRIDSRSYSVQCWRDILRCLCAHIYESTPEKLYALSGRQFVNFSKRICIQSSNAQLTFGVKVADDLWIENNFSAAHIIRVACELAKVCNLELNHIIVSYVRQHFVGLCKHAKYSTDEESLFLFREAEILCPNVDVPVSNEHAQAPLPCVNQTFSFAQPESNLSHIKPELLMIGSRSYSLQYWKDILRCLCAHIYESTPEKLYALSGRPFLDRSKRIFLQSSKKRLILGIKIADDLWIESNFSAPHTVRLACELAKVCNLELNHIIVSYVSKHPVGLGKHPSRSAGEASLPRYAIGCMSRQIAKDNSPIKTAIASILEEHFSNGIRPDSIIDLNKLKKYCQKIHGDSFLPQRIDLSALLRSLGISYGEKVFTVPEAGKTKLKELINRLIAEGSILFYYDEFYDVHNDFLQSVNIFSSNLLKEVLGNIHISLYYSLKFFSTNHNASIENEVLRAYQSAVCLSYEQIKLQIPYVPLEKIKQVCRQNCGFILVSPRTYTHVSKIEIEKCEKTNVEKEIKAEIAKHGYASLSSFDVSTSLEFNPDLSEKAIKKGLFHLFLKERYELCGNIITQKGTQLNSTAVFRDFCLEHEALTIKELLEFERELSGSVHSQSLYIAYDTMVRVNKDIFVKDNVIHFEIEATDVSLAVFVNSDVIPLQTVTSFTTFPHIDGYPWNWYLLESYCKRFSRLFQYQCLSVNSRNVGAIFRKSVGFADYTDVLATAAAAATIELDEKKVGDFLFENRYVAQRTNSISKITAAARILRERSD